MTPYYATELGQLYHGDCLESLKGLAGQDIQCCVTSPPYYGLRDYGDDGQIGLEETPDEYIQKMVAVFHEVKRVLRDDGTLWVNIGDSYNNFRSQMGPGQAVHGRDKLNGKPDVLSRKRGVKWLKEKDLIGIPWMLAFALRADGWYLRQDIIWHKPNPMPESVRDRCTKAHEYIFLLSKSKKYFYDHDSIKEPLKEKPHAPGNKKLDASRNDHDQMKKVWGGDGKRNKRSVWTVPTKPYKAAHFATFPEDLIKPCIKAGTPQGGVVLDPFFGAGTTGLVCEKLGRGWVGLELNADYCEIAAQRIEMEARQMKLFM